MIESINAMKIFILVVCVMIFGVAIPAGLSNAALAESHFQTVEKLLNVSTAARRIIASDNEVAQSKLNTAKQLFRQAEEAAKNGDSEQAESLLGGATKMLFEASRMIDKTNGFSQKDLRDFDTRKVSIDALCEAYDNIRKEKGMGPAESSELYPFVQQRLSYATELKQQNRLKQGRKVLDEAYVAAKVAIEHLRGGETLVRSLTFETSQDEYEYEIDRNDTHRMLVEVLLKEKIETNTGVKDMVNKFMDKAGELRSKADEQAGDGNYEAAISTLEQSTKEIVRAIRSAGIYIPG